MRVLLVSVLLLSLCGCTRAFWRRSADKETYAVIGERDHDPRWWDPHVLLDKPPASRLFDPFNPDRPPLPPDDPAAHRYMHCANGMRGYRFWHKQGDAPWIIDPDWLNYLPRNDDGALVLTPESSIEQALLHSREYQTQIQQVYLAALALTLNRFEFALHWFAINDTLFTHFGSSDTEVNTTTSNSSLGFTKALAAGGQLLMEFANNLTLTYAGGTETVTASSNIIVNVLQPWLRGFGRQVRMEALTEGERETLYAVRTFARFRKIFSFQVLTQQYLSLVSQSQNVRNAQVNVDNNEQNYRLQVAMRELEVVGSVQVDQAYFQLLTSRQDLIQFEANLQTSLDDYKFVLGLPPGLLVRLDDALLKPFELNSPDVPALQKELDAFLLGYRELPQVPSVAELRQGFEKLKTFCGRTVKLMDEVDAEIGSWRKLLGHATSDEEEAARERADWKERVKDLAELREELKALVQTTDRHLADLNESRRAVDWRALRDRIGAATAIVGRLFVIQTQIRVFLIQLKDVPYDENTAFNYAVENRLDLMNERGRVVDAWRQITVTANALKGVFNTNFNANIATPPIGVHPLDFRSSASQYSVGFHAEAPLNRIAERNAYRASQVNYQQERRQYITLHDAIQRDIRLDLRNLRRERINFELIRRSLLSAARQLDYAREYLLILGAEASATSTLDILRALQDLLVKKNQLIGSWVNYETARYKLLLDMELMQVDEGGMYIDVNLTPQSASGAGAGVSTPGQIEQALPQPRFLPEPK